MNAQQLSKRLAKVGEFVPNQARLADIGSDHAYLPIYLIQHELVPTAIAGEVVEGPFQNAQKKVKDYQLEDRVSVRFGNGLNILSQNDEVGTVTICGMGGILITNILSDGLKQQLLSKTTRLVLQPNNAEKEIRMFLQQYQYKIVEEAIVEENNKIYEIIVAESHSEKMEYSEEELTFGPLLSKNKSPIFCKKWEEELHINERIFKQLKNTKNVEKKKAIQNKIHQIKKVLS